MIFYLAKKYLEMEEPQGTAVTSTQKSLSSFHDSGWNDPPKSVFTSPRTSCTTPTKRLLNKRVAFPLNSETIASNSQQQLPVSLPSNLPPPISCEGASNNPPTTDINKTDQPDTDFRTGFDKECSLSETLANLDVAIKKHVESETKVHTVYKRIESMKTLWLDGKLDDCICRKVLDISRALKEEDVVKADKIHISLMMEQAIICRSWLPGISHLILEMKCKFSKCNDDSNSETSLSSN